MTIGTMTRQVARLLAQDAVLSARQASSRPELRWAQASVSTAFGESGQLALIKLSWRKVPQAQPTGQISQELDGLVDWQEG